MHLVNQQMWQISQIDGKSPEYFCESMFIGVNFLHLRQSQKIQPALKVMLMRSLNSNIAALAIFNDDCFVILSSITLMR